MIEPLTNTNNEYDPSQEYKIVTIDDINEKIKIDGDRERAQRILDTNKQLSKQIVYYEKLSKRWTFNNIIVRLIGHGLSVVASILIVIFTAVPEIHIPIPVNIFLGVFAAVESFMTEAIARLITGRRKNYFLSKTGEINKMQNKATYYIQKAVEAVSYTHLTLPTIYSV